MSHVIFMISRVILGTILACVEGAGAFRLLPWAHISNGVKKMRPLQGFAKFALASKSIDISMPGARLFCEEMSILLH